MGDNNKSYDYRYGPRVELSIGGNVYTTGANSGVDIKEGKGLKVQTEIDGNVSTSGNESGISFGDDLVPLNVQTEIHGDVTTKGNESGISFGGKSLNV